MTLFFFLSFFGCPELLTDLVVLFGTMRGNSDNGINVVVQGTSIFLPQIIAGLGKFTVVETNLRSVGPYMVAAVWSVAVSYSAWRYRVHGFLVAGSCVLSVIGYIIFLTTSVSLSFASSFSFFPSSSRPPVALDPAGSIAVGKTNKRTDPFFHPSPSPGSPSIQNPKTLYGAAFLTFSGALPNGPLFLSLATANAGTPTERAIAAAIIPSFGSFGSMASTWLYLPQFKPRYIPVSVASRSLLLGASRFFDKEMENKAHTCL